jgi:hypothetical protein
MRMRGKGTNTHGHNHTDTECCVYKADFSPGAMHLLPACVWHDQAKQLGTVEYMVVRRSSSDIVSVDESIPDSEGSAPTGSTLAVCSPF